MAGDLAEPFSQLSPLSGVALYMPASLLHWMEPCASWRTGMATPLSGLSWVRFAYSKNPSSVQMYICIPFAMRKRPLSWGSFKPFRPYIFEGHVHLDVVHLLSIIFLRFLRLSGSSIIELYSRFFVAKNSKKVWTVFAKGPLRERSG